MSAVTPRHNYWDFPHYNTSVVITRFPTAVNCTAYLRGIFAVLQISMPHLIDCFLSFQKIHENISIGLSFLSSRVDRQTNRDIDITCCMHGQAQEHTKKRSLAGDKGCTSHMGHNGDNGSRPRAVEAARWWLMLHYRSNKGISKSSQARGDNCHLVAPVKACNRFHRLSYHFI